MNEFKGNGSDSFGPIGFISHLLISLGVLFVVVCLAMYFITGDHEFYGTLVAYAGGGIITGVGFGFLNMFLG